MSYLEFTRRELLARWLPAGIIGFWRWGGDPISLMAMGANALPDGIHRAEGRVTVNDRPVSVGAPVASGDLVGTGAASSAVVVLDQAVYLVREQTRVVVTVGSKDNAVRAVIRVLNGRLLSVFGGGQHRVTTDTAVIGIRGSGLYIATDSQRTYACTCYGTARIQAVGDPGIGETVQTRHHEAPRFIYGQGHSQRITPAPVIDHTDAELIMLEALVGRRPPFMDNPSGYKY
ncbi:MAG: hypothetical protein ABIL58_04180 [Pseudomonadota bacterium]